METTARSFQSPGKLSSTLKAGLDLVPRTQEAECYRQPCRRTLRFTEDYQGIPQAWVTVFTTTISPLAKPAHGFPVNLELEVS